MIEKVFLTESDILNIIYESARLILERKADYNTPLNKQTINGNIDKCIKQNLGIEEIVKIIWRFIETKRKKYITPHGLDPRFNDWLSKETNGFMSYERKQGNKKSKNSINGTSVRAYVKHYLKSQGITLDNTNSNGKSSNNANLDASTPNGENANGEAATISNGEEANTTYKKSSNPLTFIKNLGKGIEGINDKIYGSTVGSYFAAKNAALNNTMANRYNAANNMALRTKNIGVMNSTEQQDLLNASNFLVKNKINPYVLIDTYNKLLQGTPISSQEQGIRTFVNIYNTNPQLAKKIFEQSQYLTNSKMTPETAVREIMTYGLSPQELGKQTA